MADYPYGYCGMPCALCTRYRTDGKSRCPGCSCDGYYTEPCKVHHCCKQKQTVQCGRCGEYPCSMLGKMGDFSDLNTGHAKQRTCECVKTNGFEAWYGDYCERADLLTEALARYNNGRMKRYLCELFLQRDLQDLKEIMRRASTLHGSLKEVSDAFKETAHAVCVERADEKGER